MIKKNLYRIGASLVISTALASFAFAQETPSPTVTPLPAPTVSPLPSPTVSPLPTPSPMETPVPSPMPPETPTPTPSPTMSVIAENFLPAVAFAGASMMNLDNSLPVIEYPEGKKVSVKLASNQLKNAKGIAHVTRTADGTIVNLELAGLPTNAKDYYVYTVDEEGTVSLLDEITVENGINKATLKTPMSKFMLIISPDEQLTAYNNTAAILFRSTVPQGYQVVTGE